MQKNLFRIGLAVLIISVLAFGAHLYISGYFTNKAQSEPRSIKNAKELIKKGDKAAAISLLESVVASKAGAEDVPAALNALADIYKADNNLLKAKEYCVRLIKGYPNAYSYSDVQKKLIDINMAMLFSSTPTPDSRVYTVSPGDSLAKIAESNHTTVELIKRSNGLNSDIIRPGMKLKIHKLPFSVIVDKSQSRLTLKSGDEVLKIYTVSTGKNNCTPVGVFKIQNKLIDPPWYSPKGVLIPSSSPDNALGTRWMGFNIAKPDYGIHGTNDPKSIGYQCTEGCVRMQNSDAEELYAILPIGTEVTIID